MTTNLKDSSTSFVMRGCGVFVFKVVINQVLLFCFSNKAIEKPATLELMTTNLKDSSTSFVMRGCGVFVFKVVINQVLLFCFSNKAIENIYNF